MPSSISNARRIAGNWNTLSLQVSVRLVEAMDDSFIAALFPYADIQWCFAGSRFEAGWAGQNNPSIGVGGIETARGPICASYDSR